MFRHDVIIERSHQSRLTFVENLTRTLLNDQQIYKFVSYLLLFTSTPDFSPYNAQPVLFTANVSPLWLELTRNINFSRPDSNEIALQEAIMKSEGLPRPRDARKSTPQ